MNKQIRLLVESFFDDEIFDVGNDIKTDIEDLGRYYDYQVGDIYYLNKKPYAICCGDKKYFNDNKLRFCLLNDSKHNHLEWRKSNELVTKLQCFKYRSFNLTSINDFKHIDEDGYMNTQIIKNNYYDISEFPAFEYCLNLNDNIYLPAINELQILCLNKDIFKNIIDFSNDYYWSSTQYSENNACYISTDNGYVDYYFKNSFGQVRPFFYLD